MELLLDAAYDGDVAEVRRLAEMGVDEDVGGVWGGRARSARTVR
jgi:hypothetical protein